MKKLLVMSAAAAVLFAASAPAAFAADANGVNQSTVSATVPDQTLALTAVPATLAFTNGTAGTSGFTFTKLTGQAYTVASTFGTTQTYSLIGSADLKDSANTAIPADAFGLTQGATNTVAAGGQTTGATFSADLTLPGTTPSGAISGTVTYTVAPDTTN